MWSLFRHAEQWKGPPAQNVNEFYWSIKRWKYFSRFFFPDTVAVIVDEFAEEGKEKNKSCNRNREKRKVQVINYADSFSALHLTICRNIFSKLLRNDFRRIRYKNSSRDQVEIVVMPHAVLKIISHRFWVYVENVLGLVTRASTFFAANSEQCTRIEFSIGATMNLKWARNERKRFVVMSMQRSLLQSKKKFLVALFIRTIAKSHDALLSSSLLICRNKKMREKILTWKILMQSHSFQWAPLE